MKARIDAALFLVFVTSFVCYAQPTAPAELISNRCSAYPAPSIPAPLRTFYIDAENGNDGNDGLSNITAWKTLQKANNTAIPGDLFLLRGVFGFLPGNGDGQWINPGSSGTATNKITFMKEPGQTAIIETGLSGGAISLIGKSHIVIDGLELRNLDFPITLYGGTNNIWLRNLYVHDSGDTKFVVAHDNRIEDSVFDEIGDPEANEGDAILLLADPDGNASGNDDNIVVRNYIGKAGHGGYDDTLQGASVGFNNNNIVAQNVFNNEWATNVILGGRSIGTLLECNVIKNASQDTPYPNVIDPAPGVQLSGDESVIRYNQIYNNGSFGFLVQGYIFAGHEQYPEDNHIYQNTLAGNGSAGLFMSASDAGYPKAHAYVRNNLIENNIFWDNGGYDGANEEFYDIVGDFYSANDPWEEGDTDGNVFRYNNTSDDISFLIVIRQSGDGGNLHYATPASFESENAAWTQNTQIDPLFRNASSNDFSLFPISALIDEGRLISGVIFKGSAPDLGAIESNRQLFDFDGDGRADVSVFRPSNTTWYLQLSSAGYITNTFGASGDLPTPADYDGDAKTDVAVFRPSTGQWHVLMSSSQSTQTYSWGSSGDLPVPGDYDGDGFDDLVVFRPSNNTWYSYSVNPAATGPFAATSFGASGDKPVRGDFDADGKNDIAVFRPSNNSWYIQRSSAGYFVQTWGQTGDIPAPADFDGDGATDLAIFRPSSGQWFLFGIATSTYGQSGDIPVAADYDGDAKADIAVFRPSNLTWYIARSTAGIYTPQFGQTSDIPTQSAFSY